MRVFIAVHSRAVTQVPVTNNLRVHLIVFWLRISSITAFRQLARGSAIDVRRADHSLRVQRCCESGMDMGT